MKMRSSHCYGTRQAHNHNLHQKKGLNHLREIQATSGYRVAYTLDSPAKGCGVSKSNLNTLRPDHVLRKKHFPLFACNVTSRQEVYLKIEPKLRLAMSLMLLFRSAFLRSNVSSSRWSSSPICGVKPFVDPARSATSCTIGRRTSSAWDLWDSCMYSCRWRAAVGEQWQASEQASKQESASRQAPSKHAKSLTSHRAIVQVEPIAPSASLKTFHLWMAVFDDKSNDRCPIWLHSVQIQAITVAGSRAVLMRPASLHE